MEFLKDSRFLSIRNAVNNIMKDLQRKGFGTNPRKADIISEITEELLWTKGLLGVEPSQKLLQTVVFILGLNLGLRTGEHKLVKREMFRVSFKFCHLNSIFFLFRFCFFL